MTGRGTKSIRTAAEVPKLSHTSLLIKRNHVFFFLPSLNLNASVVPTFVHNTAFLRGRAPPPHPPHPADTCCAFTIFLTEFCSALTQLAMSLMQGQRCAARKMEKLYAIDNYNTTRSPSLSARRRSDQAPPCTALGKKKLLEKKHFFLLCLLSEAAERAAYCPARTSATSTPSTARPFFPRLGALQLAAAAKGLSKVAALDGVGGD